MNRSATIKCIKNSHFAVLDRKSYEIVLKNIEAQILKERTDLLHSIPCFKSCSLKAVQRITYYFKKLTFTSGQIVYKTNDRHTRIYVVKSGEFEVDIYIYNNNNNNNNNNIYIYI